jgi:hypothetical protein
MVDDGIPSGAYICEPTILSHSLWRLPGPEDPALAIVFEGLRLRIPEGAEE